jgi:hypothetical protein
MSTDCTQLFSWDSKGETATASIHSVTQLLYQCGQSVWSTKHGHVSYMNCRFLMSYCPTTFFSYWSNRSQDIVRVNVCAASFVNRTATGLWQNRKTNCRCRIVPADLQKHVSFSSELYYINLYCNNCLYRDTSSAVELSQLRQHCSEKRCGDERGN